MCYCLRPDILSCQRAVSPWVRHGDTVTKELHTRDGWILDSSGKGLAPTLCFTFLTFAIPSRGQGNTYPSLCLHFLITNNSAQALHLGASMPSSSTSNSHLKQSPHRPHRLPPSDASSIALHAYASPSAISSHPDACTDWSSLQKAKAACKLGPPPAQPYLFFFSFSFSNFTTFHTSTFLSFLSYPPQPSLPTKP